MAKHPALLARVEALHREGLSNPEIGKRVGLSRSQVWKLLNPAAYRESARKTNAKRAGAKRAWERDPANKMPCVRCGGPTGHTPGQGSRAGRCLTCAQEATEEFRRAIIAGYRAGDGPAVIAARLGTTTASIASEAMRLRKAGVDVPYAPYAEKRRRAPLAA